MILVNLYHLNKVELNILVDIDRIFHTYLLIVSRAGTVKAKIKNSSVANLYFQIFLQRLERSFLINR